MEFKWNEGNIARILAQKLFQTDICLVPNCTWTGSETDLLVVTTDLFLIDVEIKISRTDLKNDLKKDKWWSKSYKHRVDPQTGQRLPPEITERTHPYKIWKHYYAFPKDLWIDDLYASIPSASGVLLLSHWKDHLSTADQFSVHCIRRAKPNRKATPILTEHALEIARLANIRMWNAYKQVDVLQEELKAINPAPTHPTTIL
jgi:hypothetical protein